MRAKFPASSIGRRLRARPITGPDLIEWRPIGEQLKLLSRGLRGRTARLNLKSEPQTWEDVTFATADPQTLLTAIHKQATVVSPYLIIYSPDSRSSAPKAWNPRG